MLPNANGAVVTTLALMSAGKVPAMINFTAGSQNVLSACQTAQVTKVLTSRAFIAQAKLEQLVTDLENEVEFLWLEDIRQDITLMEKIGGYLGREKALVKRAIDDVAVVLFTSGSEGRPKGVALSHRNVLANATQAARAHRLHPHRQIVQCTADVPFLWPDRRHDSSVGLWRAGISLSLALALSHCAGADL